ncbi:hypothetical protein [Pyrodictium delaneyi]|uniref:hypothetical protein n=1 Tax=Pyrodictium delaneyi TaxID=1273541 RepID=UPI0035563928
MGQLLLLVAVLVASLLQASSGVLACYGPRVDGLRGFLEAQYVPEAGLLRAAVAAYPDNATIWVASDNLLAARALLVLGSPLAGRVLEALERYGGGFDGVHEVLIGYRIPGVFYEAGEVVLGEVYSHSLGAVLVVKRELHCCRVMEDWSQYADLVVYRALDQLLAGDIAGAERLYRLLMSMWDGRGFRDAAFSGAYESYKLALAVYLHRALAAAGSPVVGEYWGVVEECCRLLKLLQRGDGSIATHYRVDDNGAVVPVGDANVETTSITVLALYSAYPLAAGLHARMLELLQDPACG